ncbi:Myb/SANT-like domain, harbinger transposase-derived nuclease domain protein [Tanacetum coccineum]
MCSLANKERAGSEVCCEYQEYKSGTPADCTSLGISKSRTSLILAWRKVYTSVVDRTIDIFKYLLLNRFIKGRHLCNRNHYLTPICVKLCFKVLCQWCMVNGPIQSLGICVCVVGHRHLSIASGASAIRERDGALNMDSDPLALVDVAVDDDDDDDDGNSRAHKIHTMQSRQMQETWMTLPSEPDVLKGWIELTGLIMDYNQQLALIIVMNNYLRYVRSRKGKRKRDNNSAMPGHQFTLELLQGNDRQCVELLRMSRDSFIHLCTHFRVKEWLKDSKHVSVEEKMAMFVMMLGHNQRYVVIKNRFQHSTQTIHKFFHEVLAKMVVFAKEIIIPTNFNLNPTVPSHNRRLRQIFKGDVGALDGTLIHARVPINKQHLYRGRGKAHDSRILSEAIRNQNAPFPLPPPDKYYLCDATYAHTRGFMAPYRNVRYWLGDFRRRRALNSKEKFNHSHEKLRNVVEHAYGVLKARFPILKRMAPFSLTTQRNITIACFALHNFIRKEGLDDELFSTYDQSNVQLDNENVLVEDDGGIEEDEVVQPQGNASDRQYMTNLRDQIAQQLMQSG